MPREHVVSASPVFSDCVNLKSLEETLTHLTPWRDIPAPDQMMYAFLSLLAQLPYGRGLQSRWTPGTDRLDKICQKNYLCVDFYLVINIVTQRRRNMVPAMAKNLLAMIHLDSTVKRA